MKQADIFLQGEGDAWLKRNREKLGEHDPVSEIIHENGIRPGNVLEVGCADGWRLAKLRDKYGCKVMGIEPSKDACLEAAKIRVPVLQLTASTLPFTPELFDVVIYGFCLYLTDPEDWFRIAAEGDTVLKEGGYLIIHDFGEPGKPFARAYEHRDPVLSYHIDFAKLWLGNPLYFLVSRSRRWHDGSDMVTVLRKTGAWHLEIAP